MTKWRILIVDDEPDVLSVVQTALSRKYEVATAESGRDALERLNFVEPDFIVLDVKMPDMDGYEVCKSIRSDRRFKDTPVLFLSVLDTREDMKKGYLSGANLFLTKPFDPLRLLKNIEVFVERNPPAYRRKRFALEDLAVMTAPAQPSEESKDHPPARKRKAAPVEATPVEAAPVEAAPAETTPRQAVPEAGFEDSDFPRQPSAAQGLKPRLLFVIDDSKELAAMAEACEGQFEFAWAYDGPTALENLDFYEPDMMILDATGVGVDGFLLCQKIRQNVLYRRIPIVIYSAKDDAPTRESAARSGASALVKRPSSVLKLIETLRSKMIAADLAVRPKQNPLEQVLDFIEFGKTEGRLIREDPSRIRRLVEEKTPENEDWI